MQCSNKHQDSRGLRVSDLDFALIAATKTSGRRTPFFLLFLFFFKMTRRFMHPHMKREKDKMHMHDGTAGRATYFCRRRATRSCYSHKTVPSLRSYIPSVPPFFIFARGGQPLLFIPYPLFFILYIPVCLGRQTRVPRMA